MKSVWVKRMAVAAFAGAMSFAATVQAKPSDHQHYQPQAQAMRTQGQVMSLRGDSASMQRSMDNAHPAKDNGGHLPMLNPRTHMPAK